MAEDEIPDRGSGRYENGKPVRATDRLQKVLNESWPDEAGQLGDAPPDRHVSVLVRIDFEHDGVEILPGRMTRWTHTHVFVKIDDPRIQLHQVWVKAEDAKRA